MKIVTWNVNSVNVRLPNILKYLRDYQPDILCLQELKCSSDKYPLDSIKSAGYHSIQACQKTYNGVSIISKIKSSHSDINPVCVTEGEMRSIAATFGDIRVINFYVVNGQSLTSDKYKHKIKWLEKAHEYISNQLKEYEKLLVLGDFNIVPNESDAYDFSAQNILCSDRERESLQNILDLGLTDCYEKDDSVSPYTWWDYRAGAFHRDIGFRIDLILSSQALIKTIHGYTVHKETRHKSWCADQPKHQIMHLL